MTNEEWDRFFSLIDLSQVPEDDRDKIMAMFKASAQNNPLARRLFREQTAPFSISQTEDDMYDLKTSNASGLGGLGHITWQKDLGCVPATALHEMRHIQQFKEELWGEGATKEIAIIANKLQEAECACISAEFDSQDTYFKRLLLENEFQLQNQLKEGDFPYAKGLNPQEKRQARLLYIHEQAMQKTIGQYMALLMQKEGADTVALASSYGLCLTAQELDAITSWRQFYNEQALKRAKFVAQHSLYETNISQDELKIASYVRNKMIAKYPVLKDLPFFQTGFSKKEALEADIVYHDRLRRGVTYFQGTNVVLKDCRIENGRYVTRVYYNDHDHTLAYECTENSKQQKEGKEVYYNMAGKAVYTNFYEKGVLKKTVSVLQDGQEHVIDYSEEKQHSDEFVWLSDDPNEYKKEVLRAEGDIYYRDITYHDGRRRYGYEDEAFMPIGEWHYLDGGKKRVIHYQGCLVKDEKTGKMVPKRIKSPKITLNESGYQFVPSNSKYLMFFKALKENELIGEDVKPENVYMRMNDKNEVSFAILSKTQQIMQRGHFLSAYQQNKLNITPTGIWFTYNEYTSILSEVFYDEDGNVKSEYGYEDTPQQGNLKRVYFVESGQEFYKRYASSGVVMEASVYDQQKMEYTSDYKRHKNKALHMQKEGDNYRYYTHDGMLYYISYQDGSAIEFYPQKGVNDEAKLKKKAEIKLIYNEKTKKWDTQKCAYRKDGTLIFKMVYDENGDGQCTFFDIDGKRVTSQGPIQVKDSAPIKAGEWSYYTEKGVKKIIYQDGQIQSEQMEAVESLNQTAIKNTRVNASRHLSAVSSHIHETDEPLNPLSKTR